MTPQRGMESEPSGAELKAAQAEVERCRSTLRKALEKRDRLVVQAIDVDHLSLNGVARIIGTVKANVVRILSDSGSLSSPESSDELVSG